MNRMVLLIDSDTSRRERLREALFANGLTALGSGNTEQGLHILAHNRLSMVIVAESDWHILSGFCLQTIKRWPKTKIVVLGEHLPSELASTGVVNFSPILTAAELVSQVMQVTKEKSVVPSVDLDMADMFDDISGEGIEPAPSSSVPSFIDFGNGASLDQILSGSHKPPKKKPTAKKVAPTGFDFDIPIPPLKKDTPLAAVEIDSSELELIIEDDELGNVEGVSSGADAFLQMSEDDLDDTIEGFELELEPLPDPSLSGEAPAIVDLDLQNPEIQGAPGAVWLMKIASEKRSGRLFVDYGPAQGTLYFACGEGVWAEFKNGVDGLRDYLHQKDIPTPSGLTNDKIGEGEFLFKMVDHAVFGDEQIVDVILGVVRERILQLAFEGWGDFRFEIDDALGEVPSLMSVHPFGLILESRQKELAPAALIGLSSELEAEVLKAGPASDWIGDSLDRFLNNMNLSSFLEKKPTVGDFFTASALGPITGTLMILALRDTQVIMTKSSA